MQRESLVAERAARFGVAVLYVNLVGGQDELVFDGGSFVVDARAGLRQRSVSSKRPRPGRAPGRCTATTATVQPFPGAEEEVYRALVMGTRD